MAEDDEYASLLRMYERRCRYFLENYIETGNPLWAWEAFFVWLAPQWTPKPKSFPLPRELIWFFLEVSSSINGLASGSRPPEYRDGAILEPKDGWEIYPREACDFLPEALKLRGHKWNAFIDWKNEQFASQLWNLKTAMLEDGASEREAMEQVMIEAGTTDERTARRKLQGGRGPRQSPPYPAPKWVHDITDAPTGINVSVSPPKRARRTKRKATGAKKA